MIDGRLDPVGVEHAVQPGVQGGDFDADIAQWSSRGADAVLWLYADALPTEEAEILQMLMAMRKPVLMVDNAKWRIDSTERLQLFCAHHHPAFRHTEGDLGRGAA